MFNRKWILLIACLLLFMGALYFGNARFNDNVIAKGKTRIVRSITGNVCSMSVEQARYSQGVITVESFVRCNFSDSQFKEIFKDCKPGIPTSDARLSGTVKGLLEGKIYLENKNGIKREPIRFNVDANSELKCASLEIAFEGDDKDKYTLNVESYKTDTQKEIIKFSLK